MVCELRAGILPALQQWGLAPAPGRADPERPTVTLAFDREGWSPELFRHLQRHGVACVTWRKGPQTAWPAERFHPAVIPLRTPLGVETARGALAERTVTLEKSGLEVREIRFWINERQSQPGRSGRPRRARQQAGQPAPGARQPAIITTHPDLPAAEVIGLLRSRWSQENHFKYMRAEFGLDSLPEHATVEVDPATKVVNPDRRVLQRCIDGLRSRIGTLHRQAAAATRGSEAASEARAELRTAQRQLEGLEHVRSHTPTHVRAGDLPAEARLRALPDARRYLLDGLRMIAYRAETSLAHALAPRMGKPAEVRSLLRQVFQTPASLLPDAAAGTLTVRLAHLSCRADDDAVAALMGSLNEHRTLFPNTALRLRYERSDGSAPSPAPVRAVRQ